MFISHFSLSLSSLFILHRLGITPPSSTNRTPHSPFQEQRPQAIRDQGPSTDQTRQQENSTSRPLPFSTKYIHSHHNKRTSPPSSITLSFVINNGIRTRFRIPQGRLCDVDHPSPSGLYYLRYHVPEQLLGVRTRQSFTTVTWANEPKQQGDTTEMRIIFLYGG